MTLSDFTIILTTLGSIASVIISVVALNNSHKTFKRGSTFDNENHYYEYKFNTYVEIIKKLTTYAVAIEYKISDAHDMYTNKEITYEELLDSADEIDEIADTLQKEITPLTAFIPTRIIDEIGKVLDHIFHNNIGVETTKEKLKESQEIIDKIVKAIDDVQNLMVLDLGLNNINKLLAYRTRENKKVKPK